MINRFALSFLCTELDRDEMYGVTGLHILLGPLRKSDNLTTNLAACVCVCTKCDPFLPYALISSSNVPKILFA